jgi:hypothetical protein
MMDLFPYASLVCTLCTLCTLCTRRKRKEHEPPGPHLPLDSRLPSSLLLKPVSSDVTSPE